MAKLELGLECRSVFLQDPGLSRRECAPLTSEQLVYESQAKRGVQSPASYQPKDCQFVLSKFSPRPVSSTKAKPLPLIPAGLIVTTDGYLALRLRCSDLHRDLESPEWTVNPSRASPAPQSGVSCLTRTTALSGCHCFHAGGKLAIAL